MGRDMGYFLVNKITDSLQYSIVSFLSSNQFLKSCFREESFPLTHYNILVNGIPHPIPYKGSKRKLAPIIARQFPEKIETFYEPFAGSASMTVFMAHHGKADRFVLADSLKPLVNLLRCIVEAPDRTADQYRKAWERGRNNPDHYTRIRERFNAEQNPVDLLYLVCRCVLNAVRFSRNGDFTQGVDKRRPGMHPDKMKKAVLGVSSILQGKVEFRVGDWRETSLDAGPKDFVYMDPPYLGTSAGRDKLYYQQLMQQDLVAGLEELRMRSIPFALSYDGMTGGREYGPPLPDHLGLIRVLIPAGTSSQSTLWGRNENTVESLYLSPSC